MKTLVDCLYAGAGGLLGTVCRYLFTLLPLQEKQGFPLHTLLINILGAFCIGLISGWAGQNPHLPPRLLLLLKVGVCGGFTTFSAFSLEALTLAQNGKLGLSLAYILLSVVFCLGGIAFGQILVK